jgi:hypothetical protein
MWTTGLLFDNLQDINLRSSGRLVFALYNRGDEVDFPNEIGFVEGLNQENIEPASLYIAQLNARLGIQNSVAAIIYDNEMSIYPNPSKGSFIIKSLNITPIRQVQVFSMSRQLVFNKKFEPAISQIKIDTCQEGGIYLLQDFTDMQII